MSAGCWIITRLEYQRKRRVSQQMTLLIKGSANRDPLSSLCPYSPTQGLVFYLRPTSTLVTTDALVARMGGKKKDKWELSRKKSQWSFYVQHLFAAALFAPAFINNILFITHASATRIFHHLSPLILTLYCKQFFIAMKNFMQPNARASPALEVSRFSESLLLSWKL
jgi:hypothetical protein